jgi:pilus assembly protein TadC
MLNALSNFIPSRERLITIEDAAELQLQQPHVGRLETRPANIEGKGEVRQRDLVRNALRMRPDRQITEYRLTFPDLLDLLTVCVTAGLTVEASFERIRDRLSKRSRALGHNIELMGAEMRAGRSSVVALGAFADRLGLDEAASFVAVLRHSVELGGDVATTLREFSEDMRSKRMLLAEKKANEFPVKMVVPLALGIFPVILTIVLFPVILKLLRLIGS